MQMKMWIKLIIDIWMERDFQYQNFCVDEGKYEYNGL